MLIIPYKKTEMSEKRLKDIKPILAAGAADKKREKERKRKRMKEKREREK